MRRHYFVSLCLSCYGFPLINWLNFFNLFQGSSDLNKFFINDLDNNEIEDDEVLVADVDNISSSFRKTADGFRMRNKILADKLEGFSSFLDEFIAALLRKLQTTRDEVIKMAQSIESLNQKLKIMEAYKKEHEEAMKSLENDVTMLLSACSDATRELQFEIKNDLLELNSVPELGKLNHSIFQEVREVGGGDTPEHQKKLDGNKYLQTAEKLLSSSRKAQSMSKLFESTSTVAASTIQDLQKKLHETSKAFEKAIEEKDLYQNMVSKLETDVDSLKDSCRELDLKAEDYQAIKEKLNEKEAEISSLYNRLSLKERGEFICSNLVEHIDISCYCLLVVSNYLQFTFYRGRGISFVSFAGEATF